MSNSSRSSGVHLFKVDNNICGECAIDSSIAALALKFDKNLIVGDRNCCQSKGFKKFKSQKQIHVGPFMKMTVELYEKDKLNMKPFRQVWKML